MSLATCNKKHSRTLMEFKEKGKLLIPSSVIQKIHYLHHHIDNAEWSAVLIYEVVEGTPEIPSSLVLRVKDFILMDIGTGSYTEYDMTPEDGYSFDKYTDALMAGNKLGHLHTHWSMNCFFSGVDTSELHENAPNHNFYLSLIVNFKNIDQWCAAVAICADEVTTGTVKVTRTWKGKEGLESKELDQQISNTKSILYKINMILEEEKSEEVTLDDRIAELRRKKVVPTYNNYSASKTHGRGHQVAIDWEEYYTGEHHTNSAKNLNETKTHSRSEVSSSRFPEDKKEIGFKKAQGKEEEMDEMNKKYEAALDKEGKKTVLSKGVYSPGVVKQYLIKLLAGDPDQVDLEQAIKDFAEFPRSMDHYISRLEETILFRLDAYLGRTLDDMDYHCLCVSFTDLLKPYRKSDKLNFPAKLLCDLFDIYTDFNKYSPELTSDYTGLDLKEEKEDLEFLKQYQ